jgi:long-chain acyl-CoA synthetase
VPTMFVGFLNFPERVQYDLSSVRFAVSAAAPLPPEVQQQFQAVTGGKMMEAYGLTETSPAATMDPIGSPRDNSLGVPVPDTDVKIVDVETGSRSFLPVRSARSSSRGPRS